MKKLYVFLIGLWLVLSCSCPRNTQKNKDPYVYMSTKIEREYTYEQFDSLCTADHISGDLDRWDSSLFIDHNNKPVKQYMYVTKNSGKKDTTTVYTVIPNDSTVFVNKRIVIE